MASLGPSPLFWHIATTVAGLSKKTYKASVEELGQLCSLYGVEARIFLVACLLAEARDTRVPPNSMKVRGGRLRRPPPSLHCTSTPHHAPPRLNC